MSTLNFYDVDIDYIKYLKNAEIEKRGFTCVPDIEYQGERKFLCGVVLQVEGFNYYVPVTSYKQKQSESVLIVFDKDRFNQVKGSLRFNYMFPVSDSCISVRIIKNESDAKRRAFLNDQLRFCNDNIVRIQNQAKRTYTIVTKGLNESLIKNSCDFKLLETACENYILP